MKGIDHYNPEQCKEVCDSVLEVSGHLSCISQYSCCNTSRA